MGLVDREKTMKNFYEQKDMMEDKIKSGIEANRKGWFKINFVDKDGNHLKGGKVTVKQKTSEFKFGCNAFKLGCFKNDEQNADYEEKIKKLFNMITIPFYWDDFEPEQGKPRFEKDSPFIDRRIPPELALEFAKKNNIEVKGHPLFWQVMLPKWLPDDFEKIKPYWTERLKQIAERYDGVIREFDCVNECVSVPLLDYEPHTKDTGYRNSKPIDGRYPEWAFKQTAHYFKKSKLVLNETAGPWSDQWRGALSAYYLLIENLINKGCQIDVIGLQYHNFNIPETMPDLAAEFYNPSRLYKVMDLYSHFNKPLSVSEITIPGADEELQAEIVKYLYSIWFSSKNMESIIYWNLGDNCAIASENREGWGEDAYKSGFFRNDFTNKPAFDVVDELINKEWRTNLCYDETKDNTMFKAFYGDYEVTVERDGKKLTRDLHLSKNGFDEFYFEF